MKNVHVEMNVRVCMDVKCKDKEVEAVKARLTDPQQLKEQFGVNALDITKVKEFIVEEGKKGKKKEKADA